MNIDNNEAKIVISKAEAEGRNLARNSIKMIKRFEKRYDEEMISKWSEEGRMHSGDSHVWAFKQYIENK